MCSNKRFQQVSETIITALRLMFLKWEGLAVEATASLTLSILRVTKEEFLLAISVHSQTSRLQGERKISMKGYCLICCQILEALIL